MGNDRDLDPCAAMAAKLDGHDRKDFDAVVDALGDEAKAAGLVIVFGASDDGMVLQGVIDDEFGAYDADGPLAWIADGKLIKGESECDDTDCPHFRQAFELAKVDAIEIRAYWCRDVDVGGTYPVKYPPWSYELANGPDFAPFTILDDGEPWCVGIVFPVASGIDEGLVELATARAADSSEGASILAAYWMGQEDARAERYRSDAKPEGLDALIAALQIFRTYGNPDDPTHCSHDLLTLCGIDPGDVSPEDVARLDALGFSESDEEAFTSHRFGSA